MTLLRIAAQTFRHVAIDTGMVHEEMVSHAFAYRLLVQSSCSLDKGKKLVTVIATENGRIAISAASLFFL